MENSEVMRLKNEACKIRMGIIEAVYNAHSGHPGGALSIADLLAYLYFYKMNIDPNNPKMENRDRLVLSKGHSAPGLYSALANKGYFSVEELKTFRHTDARLQGHPDMKHIPGVDMSAGSLGQGVSAAAGMALSSKHFGPKFRVYAILGDGECEEGQVWEAAMFAANKNLNNLTIFVDNNNLQIDGTLEEVNSPMPLDKKFEAFNFNVVVIDGHDFEQIDKAVKIAEDETKKPTVIIMETTKGKGVSFMENQVGWHGKAPNHDEYETAMAELNKALSEIE